MKKTIKNIGLDVHRNSISNGIADDRREGEVRMLPDSYIMPPMHLN